MLTLSAEALTKRFARVRAVDDSTSRSARAGHGVPRAQRRRQDDHAADAARSRPADRGTATIDGQPLRRIADPLPAVGAVLEATNFHPGRTGRDHLRVLAAAAGVPDRASTRCSSWSASRPRPTGGPAATRWGCASGSASPPPCSATPRCSSSTSPPTASTPRASGGCAGSCAHLAAEGRTLLVSSHMLSEVEQTVDDVVIIARGRLIAHRAMAEIDSLEDAFLELTAAGEAVA